MNSEMQIEYQVNQMVNRITEQSGVRLEGLSSYPLCILFGEFPEDILQMLKVELISRIGIEEAIEMVQSNSTKKLETEVEEKIHSFRNRMENGPLKPNKNFYVPIIFMADQLDRKQIEEKLLEFKGLMKRKGFEDFKWWCYCIFDYEKMNGSKLKEQLENFSEKEEIGISICTQNNLFASNYQKYIKAIQAISMHIFLKLSGVDVLSKAECTGPLVMGYWRFDVLKQKMVDELIHLIDRQEEELLSDKLYIQQISECIDNMTRLQYENGDIVKQFKRGPVNYGMIENDIKISGFSFRGKSISYDTIFAKLYGRRDVFSEFIKNNYLKNNQTLNVEMFFAQDIGNIQAVDKKLIGVLESLKEKYTKEKQEKRLGDALYQEPHYCGRKGTISQIMDALENRFWNTEIEIVILEYKIQVIQQIIDYRKSQIFEEKLSEVRNRNRKQVNRLKLIRREVSMSEENILKGVEINIPIFQEQEVPDWKQNIFEGETIQNILARSNEIKEVLKKGHKECFGTLLSNFVEKLSTLKQNEELDYYYATKLNPTANSEEEGYIFVNSLNDKEDNILQDVKKKISTTLPNATLEERNWEAEMCIEYFVTKEIKSFDEIYTGE